MRLLLSFIRASPSSPSAELEARRPSKNIFSPVVSFGSPRSPLNKRLGLPHKAGQLSLLLLVLQPVGCLPLAGDPRFREVLRMCRMRLGNSDYNQLARSYFLELA
jgi:hypothetical protein